jgi:hypothetical protein
MMTPNKMLEKGAMRSLKINLSQILKKKHSNEEVKKTTDTTKAPATESLAMLQRWVCLLVLWSRPACHILQAGVREGKEG